MLRSLGVACRGSSPPRIPWCQPTSSVAGRAVRPTSSTVLWMHQMSQHRVRMAMTTRCVCWGSPPRAAHGQTLHRQPGAVAAVAADADDVRSMRTWPDSRGCVHCTRWRDAPLSSRGVLSLLLGRQPGACSEHPSGVDARGNKALSRGARTTSVVLRLIA